MRPAGEAPRDPYAGIRRSLHAVGIVALLSTWLGLDLRAAFGILFACEITALALRRREASAEPRDRTDTAVRLGCGGFFGIIAAPLAAYRWGWAHSGSGFVVFAIAGGVICAALALRFGQEFWQWALSRRSPF